MIIRNADAAFYDCGAVHAPVKIQHGLVP